MTSPRKLREKLEEGIMKDMRENIMHKHYPGDNEPKLTNAELRAVRKLIQVPPEEEITPEVNALLHMRVTGLKQNTVNMLRQTLNLDKEGAKVFVADLAYRGWKLTKI